MRRPDTSASRHHPTRRLTIALAVAAVLAAGLLTGCSAAPQGVLNVPGTFTVTLRQPTIDTPTGAASGALVMCLDESSAVQVTAYGSLRVEWYGSTYSAENSGIVTLTTPVIQAGCGYVRVGATCCSIPPYIVVTATKV